MAANPLEKVYDSSLKFLASLSSEEIYRTICHESMKLVDGDIASILLMENRRFKRAYSTSSILGQIKPRRKGNTYSVYKSKRPKILNVAKMGNIHPELIKERIKSDIIVPLIYKNKSIGILTVQSKQKLFIPRDARILLLISPLASLAIRKAQLTDELSKALKARDLFISMASHELKTPITTVYTYMQLIKIKASKKEPLNIDWIDNLLNEMVRLYKLIDELLHVNQIKTGKLKYNWEEIDINDILKKSVSGILTRYKDRKIVFQNNLNNENPTIIGDFEKLIEVFLNLLDNAAKYSDPESVIILETIIEKKYLMIAVRDEGQGISESDLPQIFDDFYKGENNIKSGLGLGLFIIKKIVNEHKGKISVKSEVGKGTTIHVKLPIYNYNARH